jgi:aminopeptidase N
MSLRHLSAAGLLLAASGCGAGADTSDGYATAIAPQSNPSRDVLAAELSFDLDSLAATAVIELDASTRRGATLEVGDLEIESVSDADGPVAFRVEEGLLDVGIQAHKRHQITIDYRFALHEKLEGALGTGSTFLWPYFCGNLYPCQSNPADGLRLGLQLSGVPDGAQAIYPETIPADAPAYMLAWATGEYTELALGTTAHGRQMSVWYLPGEETLAHDGTTHLLAAFEWLETTYGAYRFGDRVASVSADWGPGAFGGMEHHPFWHVSHDSLGDQETHVHEAAHGWFGNGVRLACWEDLVLSEGTVSYLTARAIEAVMGTDAGDEVWADYNWRLDDVVATGDHIAWPQSCGEIDVYTELWSEVPYMKGAFFYRAVEQEVGREAIDRALAAFYAEHAGGAASMRDMLRAIEEQTGFDPKELANAWLMSLGRPQ